MSLPAFARTVLAGSALIGYAAYTATGSLLAAGVALWLGTGFVGGLVILGAVAVEHLQDRRYR